MGALCHGHVVRSPAAHSHDSPLPAVTTWDNHSIRQTFLDKINESNNVIIPFAVREGRVIGS